MRIFGVLADTQGCGWYRMIQPFTEIARRNPGWRLFLDGIVPDRVEDVDVLVAQRTCLPGASSTFQRHCREGHVRTVLELDDDLWQLDPSNRAAYAFYTPELQAHMRRNVEMADLVTTTTETLAERLSAWNRNVLVLPNMIPRWLLRHDRPVTNGRVTIGWAGGPGHARDFGEVAAPLRRLLRNSRYRDRVEFHMIGPDWTERVTSPRSTTRHTGWFPKVEDLYRVIDFDIGIAPLRPNPFNEAKSDVKLLEYAALGIAPVLSSTGPYADAYAAGAPSRLVPGPSRPGGPPAWEETLRDLIDDGDTRVQLGKAAREWAAGRTIEGNAHLWESAYSTK